MGAIDILNKYDISIDDKEALERALKRDDLFREFITLFSKPQSRRSPSDEFRLKNIQLQVKKEYGVL